MLEELLAPSVIFCSFRALHSLGVKAFIVLGVESLLGVGIDVGIVCVFTESEGRACGFASSVRTVDFVDAMRDASVYKHFSTNISFFGFAYENQKSTATGVSNDFLPEIITSLQRRGIPQDKK